VDLAETRRLNDPIRRRLASLGFPVPARQELVKVPLGKVLEVVQNPTGLLELPTGERIAASVGAKPRPLIRDLVC
jgi:hypothetical protein